MPRQRHPVDPSKGPEVVSFNVSGQTLSAIKLANGHHVQTVMERGSFFYRVGAAIGQYMQEHPRERLDLRYTWQPVATITDRAISELDCWVEGAELYVLDAAVWAPLKCPKCNCLTVGGTWHTNATSSKGSGFHTTYLLSKNRTCKASGCGNTCYQRVRPLIWVPSQGLLMKRRSAVCMAGMQYALQGVLICQRS